MTAGVVETVVTDGVVEIPARVVCRPPRRWQRREEPARRLPQRYISRIFCVECVVEWLKLSNLGGYREPTD